MATLQDSRVAGIKVLLDEIMGWIEQTDEIIPPILARAKKTSAIPDYVDIVVAEHWIKELACDVCDNIEQIEKILYGRRGEDATENESAEN